MRILGGLAVLALTAVGLGTFSGRQDGAEKPTVVVKFPKFVGNKGGKLNGLVSVEFAPGMHGYQNPPSDKFSIPVSVNVVSKGFRLVTAKYPAGSDLKLEGSDKPQKIYEGTVQIPVVVGLPKRPGVYTLKLAVHYQQCSGNMCGPPGDIFESVTVKVADR